MTEQEMNQKNIEEFSRIQYYLEAAEKDSEVYKRLKRRYIELKTILTTAGINLIELDYLKL